MNSFLTDIAKDLEKSRDVIFIEDDENVLRNIGIQISKMRKRYGITQKEMSQKTHITQSNLSKIENGKYNVSILLLEKILHVLNAHITLEANDDK